MKKKKAKKAKVSKSAKSDPVEREFSDLIRNGDWKPFSHYFQFVPKDKTVTFRISDDLLKRLKDLAELKNTKYQRLIREALIQYLEKAS